MITIFTALTIVISAHVAVILLTTNQPLGGRELSDILNECDFSQVWSLVGGVGAEVPRASPPGVYTLGVAPDRLY